MPRAKTTATKPKAKPKGGTNPRAYPYRAIVQLAQPGTRYLLINEEVFLINGSKCSHVLPSTRKILLDEGWIIESTHHLETTGATLTQQGQKVAERIEEMKQKYIQMGLWPSNEDDNDLEYFSLEQLEGE